MGRAGAGGFCNACDFLCAFPEAERFRVAYDRDRQARRRLRGDADMNGFIVADDPFFVIKGGIHAGMIGNGFHQRAHQKRQDRQFRLPGTAVAVHGRPQIFQIGHVDFLDIGDVGNAGGGKHHLLGNLAPQPRQLHLFDGAIVGRYRLGAFRPPPHG
ncbi:hypothetical protein D3C87_1610210 [compost metagenome]